MAAKACKANLGTRKDPCLCGEPVATGMLQCCKAHADKMVRTKTPDIFTKGNRYVVVTTHRGRQVKSFHRTEAEARQAKGDRTRTDRKAPQSRCPFDQYAQAWVRSCQGRTQRGFDADTRAAYERALELYAIPHFRSMPLRDIERKDINDLITELQECGLAAASISKYLAPVRALLADAVEEGDLQSNPALGLKINRKAQGNGIKRERKLDMTPRMADTVDAAMALMDGGFDVDGQTLLRSLYEQVVTFAWVAIDPRSPCPVSGLTVGSAMLITSA
jgi:Phage integrase, N-terminal SAM-like domain